MAADGGGGGRAGSGGSPRLVTVACRAALAAVSSSSSRFSVGLIGLQLLPPLHPAFGRVMGLVLSSECSDTDSLWAVAPSPGRSEKTPFPLQIDVFPVIHSADASIFGV